MQLDFMSIIGIIVAVVFAIAIVILKVRNKGKNGQKGGSANKGTLSEKASSGKTSSGGAKRSNVKSSIPYIHTYEDGIIETSPGVYTKAYYISEVNFKIAPEDEQLVTFEKFGRILNAFTTSFNFQILIQNRTADNETSFNNIQFQPASDGLNTYRREMNELLLDKMKEGKNGIAQDKYLVAAVKEEDLSAAKKKFADLENVLEKRFLDISRESPLITMNLADRLESLYNIYNQDNPGGFFNGKKKNGNPAFDLNTILMSGNSSKEAIAPPGMDFGPSSYFMIGDTYGRTLYFDKLPNFLSSDFLADVSDINCNMIVSMHYKPIDQAKAMKIIYNQMMNIDGQIAQFQKKAGQSGYSIDLIPQSLRNQQKYIHNLSEDMTARDQKMFLITFVITVFGESREDLDTNVNLVTNVAGGYFCNFKPLYFQQEIGFNATLPLCINELKTSKMLTTQSASIFIPYTTQELHQKGGSYYGLNATSKKLILFNRLLAENHNGLIIGKPGGGKSFAAKHEMVSALLRSQNNVVYVIDPESEYGKLCKAFGGTVIDLTPNSGLYLNPLDMDIEYGDEADPVSMKTEFILSMIEIMAGKGRKLTPAEKSIVSRCVQKIYNPYLRAIDDDRRAGMDVTSDRNAAPTLNTLYSTILMQPEPEAKSVATILEMYATGALATFANHTNIETNARFVVYDIMNLGTGTKDLGIHICVNDIWNKMIQNAKKGIYTWVFIDEFYLLLQSESSAQFIASIWKRARKRLGVPTGILQNTEDLLRTEDSRSILNNSTFVEMLSVNKIDRANLKNFYSLSDAQLAYITDSGAGRGLMYANKTIIPFENDFPEDTQLYTLMSTSAAKDAIKKKLMFEDQ